MTFAIAALLLVTQRPEMDFQLRPMVGDRWSALVDSRLVGEPVERYVFRENYHVKSVQEGTFHIEVRRRLEESWADDLKIPLPEGATDDVFMVLWKKDQPAVRAEPRRDSGERRLWRLWSYVPPTQPMGMGKTWSHDFPAQPEEALPKSLSEWKLTGKKSTVDRHGVFLTMTFREEGMTPPMIATGEAVVDHITGLPLYLKIEAKNAPAPFGEASSFDYSYEYKVTDLKLVER